MYTFKDGLRMVTPYYSTNSTFAKGRWVGVEILVMFAEFKRFPLQYYQQEIESGSITVNGKRISPNYSIKNKDVIEHYKHYHEPPVRDLKIQIVHESSDLLIINKPPSIPIHPVGQYNHNTCLQILRNENGYNELHAVNRLDGLTSGLCILAKTSETAKKLMEEMRDLRIKKTYLARVTGEFPAVAECSQRLLTLPISKSVIVSCEGKESQTLFTRISFNGVTSLVECRPTTGRMHQIRVHLQYLGFPIANDHLYNSTLPRQTMSQSPEYPIAFDGCIECQNPKVFARSHAEMCIWLHSWKYSGDGWDYICDKPEWATDN